MYRPMTEQRVYLTKREETSMAGVSPEESHLARLQGATTSELGLRVGEAMSREETGTPNQRARHIATGQWFDRPPTRPEPATNPSSTEQPAQLDLDGGTVPTGPRPDPTGGRFTGPGSGQQQALPVTVARSYRSKAWGGTVTESPLDLTAEET